MAVEGVQFAGGYGDQNRLGKYTIEEWQHWSQQKGGGIIYRLVIKGLCIYSKTI